MTIIRPQSESRTVLDFDRACSKSHINRALRQCKLACGRQGEHAFTLYRNEIKVGMYTIVLELPFDGSVNWQTLREYGDFRVSICDSKRIDLKEDGRFKEQPWVMYNFFGRLKVKHLVDIVEHCRRLASMKAFL
jgi:hypothetical protein